MNAEALDTRMAHIAAAREQVTLTLPNGDTCLVTLICWRPHRRNGTRTYHARVQFPNGRLRTVSAGDIEPLPRPRRTDAPASLAARRGS